MGEGATLRLNGAVEQLYRTFASAPPPVIEGCPCCIETRGIDVLLTTPLRELTGHQLWRYVSGAFYTVGSERDFRYLLPRIFDIAANAPFESCDTEIILKKLSLSGWRDWQTEEQRAIEAFVDTWFDVAVQKDLAAIEEDDIPCHASPVLCGLSLAGVSIAPMLEQLNKSEVRPLLEQWQSEFAKPSAFWRDSPQGFAELRAYLDA